MILGIDAGSSAVKLAVLDGTDVVLTHYERNLGGSMETLNRALWNSGAREMALTQAAVTGLNGENCCAEEMGLPLVTVPEIDAIGRGGSFLSGKDTALMVNLGTGTTFVLARDGQYTHLGGTGIGGGTLIGLGRKILGITDPDELARMAAKGDVGRVDLRIGDLFVGSETLNAALTASNLAKYDPDAAPEDWAAGIVNLVLQCVGTMATLSCGGYGLDTVVLLGALAEQDIAKTCFALFQEMYAPSYLTAPKAACATAVGAALAAQTEAAPCA